MLNDKLDEDELGRQLRGMYDEGWGAVIARTFNGLRTEYLSDEWMRMQDRIVGLADELGMGVWLQAGYMPSGIPDLPEQHQHQVIVRRPCGEPAEDAEMLLRQTEEFDYYARPRANVLDLLNPEACRAYMELAYTGPWQERFGKYFGKTIETVWVDEPHFRPPLMPWTARLPERFEEDYGYSLIENLPSLFDQVGDWQTVRHHYWRAAGGMLLESYFATVSRWCEEHGISFSGHLMGEDTIQAQIGFTAACMPCYEYMQLPGIDHLTHNLDWPAGVPFILPPKQASSAAAQLGTRRVLAEMYGVSTPAITFGERKLIAEWMEMLGINYRCYHGYFYSLRGRRKRIFVPQLSYQQPWWTENRIVADHFSRLSYCMRQGEYRADVLVLHPVESGFCLYDPTHKDTLDRINEPEEIRALFEGLQRTSENLLAIHRGFHYGDETLMARHGRVEGGTLAVGEAEYHAVVLPDALTLRATTIELLEEFMRGGGTVLSVGEAPDRIDGRPDPEIERFIEATRRIPNRPETLREALDGVCPQEFSFEAAEGEASDVYIHERLVAGGRLFFLANHSTRDAVRARLTIPAVGRVERWNLTTGAVGSLPQSSDDSSTCVDLYFPPTASHLLLFKPGKPDADAPKPEKVTRMVELSGEYGVRRSSPNAVLLDYCRFRRGDGEWSDVLPVSAVQEIQINDGYEGPVTLQYRFQVDATPSDARIVIEDAADWAISVNGTAVEYAGLPYYVDRSFLPVDVADVLVEGENTVEITRAFEMPETTKFALSGLFQTASGTELEAIYLIGDFGVGARLSTSEPKPRCTRLAPEFAVTDETGSFQRDLTLEGYPFFAGRVSLTQTVKLPAAEEGERVVLTSGEPGAVLAKVKVNGKEAGALAWAPYEVDVSDLVHEGANEVEIELVTSLRNLLGPHHRPEGEPYRPGRESWSGNRAAKDWYERRDDPDIPWTEDYFVCPLGPTTPIIVEYRTRG